MCEANAYLEKEGRQELIMEGVYIFRPENGRYLLENIFGEQKLVTARLERISLMEHKIIFR